MISQREARLFWVTLDHGAIMISMVGCWKQTMLMIGNPWQDGVRRLRCSTLTENGGSFHAYFQTAIDHG